MNKTVSARHKSQARVMKALAHPTRMFMVEELSVKERCVCELAQMVGVEMPTISRHLSLLKNAGIVEDNKRGTQVFYSLSAPCVMKFLNCMSAVEPAFAKKTKSNS